MYTQVRIRKTFLNFRMLYGADTKAVMQEFLSTGLTSEDLTALFHDGVPAHDTGTFVDTNVQEDVIRSVR